MNGDILFEIFTYMSFKALSQARLASRSLRDLATTILRRRWHAVLRAFVDNPLRFRTMLRLSRSVIAGSTALHMAVQGSELERGWFPRDMDVYTPMSASAGVVEHFTEVEGYHIVTQGLVDDPSRQSLSNGGMAIITTLRRGEDNVSVDVITAITNAPLAPITFSWSTLLMNYATADTLSLAYPRSTLAGQGLLNPARSQDAGVESCHLKYMARGFSFVPFSENGVVHSFTNPSPLYCPHTYRDFEDVGCLRMALDNMEDVVQPPQVFPLHFPRWKLGGGPCQARCRPGNAARYMSLMPFTR
ncbi:hypothetical protein BV25DRAFT_1813577 [Artomyces pyxidatus]|uniref:Uncharacterized protein n=1 Tax=Artomyces pyxidatus TaxID=48021 RepID=A0ACB8SJM2_9AGAM|nr:hypothetical protein BV25DRAFT_1813577 [Artomyces pyxidatus]